MRNGVPGDRRHRFVGLNLVEALLARGDSVVILSNGPLPQMAESVFARLPGQLTLVTGDVRDAKGHVRIQSASRYAPSGEDLAAFYSSGGGSAPARSVIRP